MCLNCGCGKPHDSHGNPANITAEDLARAGRANGQSMETSARNILAGVEQLEGDAVGTMSGGRQGSDGGSGGGPHAAERGTPATES
jgi:hypothetical protein